MHCIAFFWDFLPDTDTYSSGFDVVTFLNLLEGLKQKFSDNSHDPSSFLKCPLTAVF
jgi:hypothetical protein